MKYKNYRRNLLTSVDKDGTLTNPDFTAAAKLTISGGLIVTGILNQFKNELVRVALELVSKYKRRIIK